MYLMSKNIPVMKIDIDKSIYEVLREDLLPYPLRGIIRPLPDKTRTDFGDPVQAEKYNDQVVQIRIKNAEFFTRYLASRTIRTTKANYKKLMNAAHLSQVQTDSEKAKIAIACRLLSMTDCYWLKTEDQDTLWEDVDLKHNSLSEAVALIALHGTSLTIQGVAHTPEFLQMGTSPSAWRREGGKNWFYKKSTKNGSESEIEIEVSGILDHFNVSHVAYLPASDEASSRMCKCENMATDDLSSVDAEDVKLYMDRTGGNFLQFALNLDGDSVYRMCIVDYLISNMDRHFGNWGFYQDANTGELLGCRPLMDHNHAFDERDMEDEEGGTSKIFPGKTKKEAAILSMKCCPLEAIAPLSRSDFLTEEHYASFMKRAEELGLYQRTKPNLLQKMHLAPFEEYVPVALFPKRAFPAPGTTPRTKI